MWPFKRKGLMSPEKMFAKVDRLGLKQKFWETIVEGRFAKENIDDPVLTEPGASMKRNARSESFMEQEWQRRVAAGLEPWPNDLKPSRFRFVNARVVDGRLKVTLDPGVTYHDTIGSRPAEFEKKFGVEFMPNPVAVTTVIRAKNKAGEEMLLMTIRDTKHDIKPGGYHVSFGGAMEITKDKTPTDTALREVTEEAEIKPSELTELTCLGVIKHVIGSSTEIIYEARTDVPVEDLLQRGNDGENRVIAIPATASKLREWIIVPTHANVGVTNVAVLWVGKEIIREQEGEEAATKWEETVEKMLAVRSEQARRLGVEDLERRDVERLKVKVDALKRGGSPQE